MICFRLCGMQGRAQPSRRLGHALSRRHDCPVFLSSHDSTRPAALQGGSASKAIESTWRRPLRTNSVLVKVSASLSTPFTYAAKLMWQRTMAALDVATAE